MGCVADERILQNRQELYPETTSLRFHRTSDDGDWRLFVVSEARLTELLSTSHLLFLVLALAAIGAIRVVKAISRLFQSGIEELFQVLSFCHGCYYKFLGELAEHRNSYQQQLQITKRKANHSAQKLVLASDGQSPSKSPLPT